ncbi:Outer membrane protein W precursor [Altererythrobacter epoxidivorans]|uniref:Outer membrane protein W n=1 Tax=Altererythrobacter epoxidivorans TaxID=361183 RepID=A0A0M5L4P0_9SPHN|nr:OmpW family outer membrane protein [Altererythrobacter epoxidivorans]ALE15674.1 Outer membrane protein W precursor [Altererythrobacter epoxidivorans]
MKAILAAGVTALALLASPAAAEDMAGKVQVKVLGTYVAPDGNITKVQSVDTGTTLGATAAGITDPYDTEANDNVVPTVAIEYFFSNNVSLETICCFTQHDVDGTGALAGAEMVSNARVIPATFTAKYHLGDAAFRPYVGAGVAYFLWLQDKPGETARALDVTDVDLSNEFGFALQAGADFAINDKMALTVDAKKYFIDTTASFYEGNTLALKTKHELDPWVVSAGVAFTF